MAAQRVDVREAGGRSLHVVVSSTVEVGREADVTVDDPLVSRRHLALTATPAGLLVTDLGSRNGTYRNDALVEQPTILDVGDVVRLGGVEIVVLGPTDGTSPTGGVTEAAASPPPRRTEDGPAPAAAAVRRDRFVREGDVWALTFEGVTVRLRDSKGLGYLATLLASPGREHHALALASGVAGGTAAPARDDGLAVGADDAGALLDDRAKAAYRQRLADLDEEIDDAAAANDPERLARAEAEREALVAELTRAVGLGGRDRVAASAAERARSAVGRAIRNAVDRIGEAHGALGEHLARTVRTGVYCAYEPDPRAPVRWEL